MKEEVTKDIVIIGGGIAGVVCYDYLKNRLGRNDIILIEYDKIGGRLNYYDSVFGLGNYEFSKTTELLDSINKINILLQMGKVLKVEKVKESSFRVEVTISEDNTKIFYSKIVIIATGTSPVLLDKDLCSFNLLTYKNYPFESIQKNEKIAIIGAGHTAFEVAKILEHKCCEITMFEKYNSYVNKSKKNSVDKVSLFEETSITKIQKENSKYKINFKKGHLEDKINFDNIVVCIGEKPNTEFIHDKNLINENGKLFISEFENNSTLNMSKFCEGLYGIADVVNKPLTGYILFAQAEAIRTAVAVDNFLKNL